jgi:hypothetical protein
VFFYSLRSKMKLLTLGWKVRGVQNASNNEYIHESMVFFHDLTLFSDCHFTLTKCGLEALEELKLISNDGALMDYIRSTVSVVQNRPDE